MMTSPSISRMRRSGRRLAAADTSQRLSGEGRRSRAERLDIIFRVAAAGASECSAWVIPLLERSDSNEDSTRETWRC
jgi:hypothetical protein